MHYQDLWFGVRMRLLQTEDAGRMILELQDEKCRSKECDYGFSPVELCSSLFGVLGGDLQQQLFGKREQPSGPTSTVVEEIERTF